MAKAPLVVGRWALERSGAWGAAGHSSSSQWRAVAEAVKGDVTDEGSWVSSMS